MIHPLLRQIATQPELLVEHADGYGELAGAEMRLMMRGLRRRAVLSLLALVGACAAVGLGGVAALLAAAIPAAQMAAPEVLVVVPLVALALSVVCGWLAWRSPTRPLFAHLREQWEADLALLRDVGRERRGAA